MYKIYTNKVLRVRKLTAFILFAVIMQTSATSFAQKLTLQQSHITLRELFKNIRQQTGYDVLYQPDKANTDVTIDVNFKDTPLKDVLDKALSGLPLQYTIDERTVVIKPKETAALDYLKKQIRAEIAQEKIKGKVQDATGQPIPGVSVREKGTPNGTVTDSKGIFDITVSDGKSIITFSYIGYQTQELAAKDIANGAIIKLIAQENNLQEVVVSKGYYDEKRALSTSDIGVVNAKTIQEQPVSDPIQALIGRIAGLNIQQTSGIPGSYAAIQIRGINSLGNGNDPYYVIDGVPFSSNSLTLPYGNLSALGYAQNPGSNSQGTFSGVNLGGGGQSPFSALNTDDIESIEILKDADATSIYGSKGANGVIIITTKKGKAGETKVNFDLRQGIGQVGHFMNLLNTQQYLQMMHQSYTNDGLPFPSIANNPNDGNYDLNGVWDTTRNTNWQKVLIGNTVHYTNAQASVSGGNTNTQFLIGIGYNRQTTVYPGDFEDRKGSLHFSINSASSNQKFHVQLSGSYVNDNNLIPQIDFSQYVTLAPDSPPIYNPNGSINYQVYNGSGTFSNPLYVTGGTFNAVTNNLIGHMEVSYNILPGLSLKSAFGYNHDEDNQTQLTIAGDLAPQYVPYAEYSRSNVFGTTVNQGWIIEPQLTYQKNIAKGKLNVILGGTLQQTSAQAYEYNAYGFTSDALVSDPQAASSFSLLGNKYGIYRYEALLARIGYTWDEKYLLNLTANRDGSSRFGPGRQFGNFGSIGAGWIFSKEKAVTTNLPWLSFGKLRVSYGTTGNDQIGDYQFLSTYSPQTGNSYQGINGLQPTSLTNPNFAWEVDKKLEGGIDLGFLKDRINLSVNYYRNRTSNQLVGYPLPETTGGFGGVEENLPAVVQNTGLEIGLNTTNVKTNNFSWATSINFTSPKNKLVSYPGLENSSYSHTYTVGKSLFSQKVYQYIGVNSQTGLYTFANQDVNGNIPFPQGYVASVPITQKYYGGMGNNFTYKGFELNVFIQFVDQTGYNYQHYFNQPGTDNYNEPTAILGAWNAPGQISNIQRYSTTYGAPYFARRNFQSSTGDITNTSFVSLKNIALSYHLPVGCQQWAHMQNAKIYLQGQNLYTSTRNIGLNQENNTLGLPPLRVIVAGVSASF